MQKGRDESERVVYGPHPSYDRVKDLREIIGGVLTRCREALREFMTATDQLGHEASLRQALALIRVVDPLLSTRDSGFVERGWRELPDDEFIRFVEAGLVRDYFTPPLAAGLPNAGGSYSSSI